VNPKQIFKIWVLLTLAILGFIVTVAAACWTMVKIFPR
jgi:hypothetical protein